MDIRYVVINPVLEQHIHVCVSACHSKTPVVPDNTSDTLANGPGEPRQQGSVSATCFRTHTKQSQLHACAGCLLTNPRGSVFDRGQELRALQLNSIAPQRHTRSQDIASGSTPHTLQQHITPTRRKTKRRERRTHKLRRHSTDAAPSADGRTQRRPHYRFSRHAERTP